VSNLALKVKSKECVHHFLLPEPDGLESLGRCKKCGDERIHENTIPWMSWNRWRGNPKEAKKKQEAKSAGAAEEHRRVYARQYRSKNKEGEDGKRPK